MTINLPQGKPILLGICGSHAYGLNHADSDIDMRGAYVVPTETILGIYPYAPTYEQHEPSDVQMHEVGKFVNLAKANNPNILELLYLESYEVLSKEGQALVAIRDSFLSQKVRDTYAGYAMSQIKRLKTRTDKGDASFSSDLRKRYNKHARHTFRLLDQGEQILREGTLTVRVKNREELFAIGEMPPEDLIKKFEERFEGFDEIPSDLPKSPNYEAINNILLTIREMNWKKNGN